MVLLIAFACVSDVRLSAADPAIRFTPSPIFLDRQEPEIELEVEADALLLGVTWLSRTGDPGAVSLHVPDVISTPATLALYFEPADDERVSGWVLLAFDGGHPSGSVWGEEAR